MKSNIFGVDSRQLFKQALSFTKLKILHARITLTRVVTLYFIFAVTNCFILSILQGIAFRDNSQAISAIGSILGAVPADPGLVVLENGVLQLCDSIPNQSGTNCQDVVTLSARAMSSNEQARSVGRAEVGVRVLIGRYFGVRTRDAFAPRVDDDDGSNDNSESDSDDEADDDLKDGQADDHEGHHEPISTETGISATSTGTPSTGEPMVVVGTNNSIKLAPASGLDEACIVSLRWLDDTIHNAQREDIVTFVFQLWLFVLALVTILNESIPHLVAGLLGHVLGTAWSCYRIQSTESLKNLYRGNIVPDACNGQDFLGTWWEVRITHAIPVVVMDIISVMVLCGLSYKLFSVYARQSFSRVRASAKIHRMYKTVLVFSVCLQLSGFFSIASTAMWIDIISHGTMMQLVHNSTLYLAAFIITLVLLFPWFYLGWVCIRKECNIRFIVFIVLSLFLLLISLAMFTSPLYICNSINWRLFGTMNVTAYVLSAATTILAIICRFNFGKGLAHYLQVSETLEGMDFTPVLFAKGEYPRDTEKHGVNLKLGPTTYILPVTIRAPQGTLSVPKKQRGSSIYSEQNGTAVYLSSSPPLVSELTPTPNHLSRASSKRSVVPYPAVKDIGAVRTVARNGNTRPNSRTASPMDSVESASTLLSSSRLSSTFSLGSEQRKVGLPANPRSNKSPI